MRVNANASDLASTGKVVTSYIGAKPPANTGESTGNPLRKSFLEVMSGLCRSRESLGFHRYLWLAYEQRNGEINPPSVEDFPARRNWPLEQWLTEYGLEGPVAGNFFEVFDE